MKNVTSGISVDRVVAIFAVSTAVFAAFWFWYERVSTLADLQTLRAELAGLRAKIAQLETSSAPVSAARSPEPAPGEEVTVRQVHEWVWGLEQRLVRLEDNIAQAAAASRETTVTRAPEIDLAQMRQAAINPQASVEERLAALRALRTADARTPDVVQAMLQLEATSTDAKVRADIFRQLSGVRDPVLKPHLINGMLKDADPKVREEAAETLAPFGSDPYVQSALKAAAQNDPDQKVRKQALESLQKRGGR